MRIRKQNPELTRAELEVMQIIWRLGKAFLGEVVEAFTQPRPAYTTISTVIHTLKKKGYVAYKAAGKSYCYYPAVTKEEYRSGLMRRVVSNFFNDSPGQLFSFFAESGSLSVEQYEELKQIARQIALGGDKK